MKFAILLLFGFAAINLVAAKNSPKEEAKLCLDYLEGAFEKVEIPMEIGDKIDELRKSNVGTESLGLVDFVESDEIKLNVKATESEANELLDTCNTFQQRIVLLYGPKCSFNVFVGPKDELYKEMLPLIRASAQVDKVLGAFIACYKIQFN